MALLYNAFFRLLLPLLGGYVIAWLGAQPMVIGMALGGFLLAGLILFGSGRGVKTRALGRE